jgi:hypothetical protein
MTGYIRKVCVDGVRWVINFRAYEAAIIGGNKEKISQEIRKLGTIDGHSGGSYNWTKKQSALISEVGWDRWFRQNKGYLVSEKDERSYQ